MSYCRWSECDVYAYDSCEGGVRFHVAGDGSLDRLCGTYNEAYQYAKELRDEHGLDVPSHAIEALREDAIDETKRINGPSSAVAELSDENAKLRELAQRLLTEYRYIRERPRKTYLEHEKRMRAIEDEMRSLGIEVTP